MTRMIAMKTIAFLLTQNFLNTVLAKNEVIKKWKKRKETLKPYNTPLKKKAGTSKKSNNCLRTNDSEKKIIKEEKLNSTIDHFQNDREKIQCYKNEI